MEINERITKILEYSGFTASEFADEIEVQRSSISHIVSGRNKPSLEFIMKIKNRFPELSWDWIINGYGEMKQEVSPTLKKAEQSVSPDLFTLIDEDYKNEIFVQENIQNEPEREIHDSFHSQEKVKISDSQRLETKNDTSYVQNIVNEAVTSETKENKIKKIVFFYENGKFESFEP